LSNGPQRRWWKDPKFWITTVVAVGAAAIAGVSLIHSNDANNLARQNMVPQVAAKAVGLTVAGLAPAASMPPTAAPNWEYQCDVEFTLDNIGRGDAAVDSYDVVLSASPTTTRFHVRSLSGVGPTDPASVPFESSTLSSIQFAVLKAPVTMPSTSQLLGAPEDHLTFPIPAKGQMDSGFTLRTVFQTSIDFSRLRKSTETGANPGDPQISVTFIPTSAQDPHAHSSLAVPCFNFVAPPTP
jgi:hypothetical protein